MEEKKILEFGKSRPGHKTPCSQPSPTCLLDHTRGEIRRGGGGKEKKNSLIAPFTRTDAKWRGGKKNSDKFPIILVVLYYLSSSQQHSKNAKFAQTTCHFPFFCSLQTKKLAWASLSFLGGRGEKERLRRRRWQFYFFSFLASCKIWWLLPFFSSSRRKEIRQSSRSTCGFFLLLVVAPSTPARIYHVLFLFLTRLLLYLPNLCRWKNNRKLTLWGSSLGKWVFPFSSSSSSFILPTMQIIFGGFLHYKRLLRLPRTENGPPITTPQPTQRERDPALTEVNQSVSSMHLPEKKVHKHMDYICSGAKSGPPPPCSLLLSRLEDRLLRQKTKCTCMY